MSTGLRVLVIGITRIGDTLLLTPVFRAIKSAMPDAHLTVISHPNRQAVLLGLPEIDALRGSTKNWLRWQGWLACLGSKPFDVALVYGRDARLLRYANRVAPQVYCFDEKAYAGISSAGIHKVPLPTASIHAVDERLLLVNAWCGSCVQDRRLYFSVQTTEQMWAQRWLEQAGLNGLHPLLGLQVCSFPTKAHRDWPIANFVELVERLLLRYPSARFLVLGDRVAAEQGALLRVAFPENVVITAGTLSLRETAALMMHLDLYVGVDTGPTHLAGALQIPMVAMYHHRYPGRNLQPLGHPRCVVLEHPATCLPPNAVVASAGMDAITVACVVSAAEQCLEGGRG